MTVVEIEHHMELHGTEQNKKVYRNHGITGEMYGVSFAVLGKLQKQIKKNAALAIELWQRNNHDERVLATMIMDPLALTESLISHWVEEVNNYVLADVLAKLISGSPIEEWCIQQWLYTDEEWKGQIAWDLVALTAVRNVLPETSILESYIYYIEQNIHRQKNRVRHAMNNTLIAVGMHKQYRERVFRAADIIGHVVVDHGKTNCKTPEIKPYIAKIEQRKQQKVKGINNAKI